MEQLMQLKKYLPWREIASCSEQLLSELILVEGNLKFNNWLFFNLTFLNFFTENISLSRDEDKAQGFEFVRNLLTLLLNHGLDPNVKFSQRANHILLSLMDMVQNARQPKDLTYVYDLTLTLITYGANPNVIIDDACNDDPDYCSVPPTPPPSSR